MDHPNPLFENRKLKTELLRISDDCTVLVVEKYPKDTDLRYLPRGYYLSGSDGGDGMSLRLTKSSLLELKNFFNSVDLEDPLLEERSFD